MQLAQLAILYGLENLNTYNGHLRREREKRIEVGSEAVDIIRVREPEHV